MLSTTAITTGSSSVSSKTQAEKLHKNIESIIDGSLPYYKSIYKQMILANLQNANTLFIQNSIKKPKIK